ncbi:glycoside hydrolase family 16 protein [Mycena floridula]|nr:glycoside hydrolase family 16 protein [Mycena floridula]
MLFSTFLRLASIILTAQAISFAGQRRHHEIARSAQLEARATKYKLEDMYQGESFINDWDFFSNADPTHGLVDYVTRDEAKASKLAYVQEDGTTVLAVDNSTWLDINKPRKSVRISSKKTYNGGLFIADFFAMPHGCSTWPAYWSVGPNWPKGGEIDILEGVNDQTSNQLTLHTSTGCQATKSVGRLTSKLLNTQCATIDGDNLGCRFLSNDTQLPKTYGHGFNMIAGGVYAHSWTDAGIKVWHFPRTAIPADITAKNPDPSTWGAPIAFWSSASCDISEHFKDHSLIIDTTLCGDFAGAVYGSSGCPGTCAEAVQNPKNFAVARWMLNYIAVYQQS